MRKLSMDELNRLNVNQFKQTTKTPLVVVLDNVRSLHNIGSVFRTADAFLIESVFLCGITAKPPHREIQKTALGSTESVDWKYFETTTEAIHSLAESGYQIVGVEQTSDSIPMHDFHPKQKTALVFGNEVEGIDDAVLAFCDRCIEIPQHGTKHSLNISVCAGIVLHDSFIKLRKTM